MKAFTVALIFFVVSFGSSPAKEQQQNRRWSGISPELQLTTAGDSSNRAKRSSDVYNRWLDIIARYGQRGDQATPWSPFHAQLPVGPDDTEGHPSLLPILVLPIPVPYPNSKSCDATHNKLEAPAMISRSKVDTPDKQTRNKFSGGIDVRASGGEPVVNEAGNGTAVTSDYLIELFRQQTPLNPELPPAVFDEYLPTIVHPSPSIARGYGSNGAREYLPPAREASPPLPQFDKSMIVKGYLTVHKADYTEAYTAMYDANTGAARVEYHDQSALTVRTMTPDGFVQRFARHTDRTTNEDIRVCDVSQPTRATQEDRVPPALPDTNGFTFGGYRVEYGVRAEVWRREIQGRTGELGAERGEALGYRHELLVTRKGENNTVPLKYTVMVDSSVLGRECEGYEHVYSEVREKDHDQNIFRFDPSHDCEMERPVNPKVPEHMARLEPLREFTLPYRDTRYDEVFDEYQKEFERSYADEKEAAMRKTILIQKNRFISSCNRQSGTFNLEVNFLSDRLEKEIEILLGAAYSDEYENAATSFPYDTNKIQELQGVLPKEFDWRPRGAVTPVKFQGAACSSCWAFAVVGSVEGAFFIRTSTLMEFSEQSLVDCGHTHGCHGCKGTWPAAAFKYVIDRGLPSRAEYTPYQEKVLMCKVPPIQPVTHIETFFDVTPNNIDALKVAIRRFAPTVVVVDAKCQTFISYKKGVLHDDRCIKAPKKKLNHAVLAVGWGELRNDPYFIIKNSWSAMWGEGGYINLHAPSNTAGHLTTPNYPRLYTRNIDKLPPGAKEFRENDGLDASDNERR